MKAIILLGTLKKKDLSNTQVLCEFFSERARMQGVECEIIKLVDHNILPGTYLHLGERDEWPKIFEKILTRQIIIFATPIWWGGHASEIQRVIERLDEVHDEIMSGKQSRLYGKVGGIIITGDSDGTQHVIGNIANFFNAMGILLPPFATLSVLWEGQRKDKPSTREELLNKYKQDYAKIADTMVKQLLSYVQNVKL